MTAATFPTVEELRTNDSMCRSVTNIVAVLSARDGATKGIRLFTNFLNEGVREIVDWYRVGQGPYTLRTVDANGESYLTNWYGPDMFVTYWVEQ